VLAEVAPFPVAANESVLIEEAHVSRAGVWSFGIYQRYSPFVWMTDAADIPCVAWAKR
jgi:hypothetical protein